MKLTRPPRRVFIALSSRTPSHPSLHPCLFRSHARYIYLIRLSLLIYDANDQLENNERVSDSMLGNCCYGRRDFTGYAGLVNFAGVFSLKHARQHTPVRRALLWCMNKK